MLQEEKIMVDKTEAAVPAVAPKPFLWLGKTKWAGIILATATFLPKLAGLLLGSANALDVVNGGVVALVEILGIFGLRDAIGKN